jgi:hypothetical protein
MRFRFSSLAVLSLLILAFAAPASAGSITVHGWETGETITLAKGGRVVTAMLDVTVNGISGNSFCVDLDHTIGQSTYNIRALLTPAEATASPPPGEAPRNFVWAGQVVNQYGKALDSWGPGITRQLAITGTQAAIWEGIYGGGIVDASSLSAGARFVYDTILANAGGSTGNVKIVELNDRQDQTFQPAIPEPTAALVFGVGLLITAAGGTRRRR